MDGNEFRWAQIFLPSFLLLPSSPGRIHWGIGGGVSDQLFCLLPFPLDAAVESRNIKRNVVG